MKVVLREDSEPEIEDLVEIYQSMAQSDQHCSIVLVPCFIMSRQFDPNVTVYSDKASMVNSSNGETTLPVVTP